MSRSGQPLSYDVVVVGAGPAGSNTARLLAEQGHRVLALEEDAVVGQPMQCAGLVTRKLFQHVPVRISDVEVNWVRGADVYAPDGRVVRIDAGEDHAVVMDREGLDRRLADAAVAAGAELWTEARYVGSRYENGGVLVDVERKVDDGVEALQVRAPLLVGADGVQSNVGRDFGIDRPREFLGAFEAEIGGLRLPETNIIPLFTDQEMAPAFFSWIIPIDRSVGRGGLCMRPRRMSARAKFDAFLDHPQVRPYVDDAKILKPIVGTVPLGMPKRFTTDRVLLVGDACAMPKPTSGGGIWTGLVASTYAAQTAHEALVAGDTRDRNLRGYARRFWRSKVGREIRIGWRIRRAFASLSNDDLNEIVRLLSNRRAVGVIDTFGDIDHPSHLMAPLLLAEPRLLKFVPKIVRHAVAA